MGSLATAQDADTLVTNLVQNVNIKLTAYTETETGGFERVKVTSRDVVNELMGAETRRGRLQWVSPQVFTEVPVQQVDEDGNPVFDGDGNPVYVPVLDTNGVPVVDELGNPVYVTELIGEPAYLRIETGRDTFVDQRDALTRTTLESVEDNANANKKTVYSIDTWNLNVGTVPATLQGFTTSKFRNRVRNGVDLGTVGSLKSSVNGYATGVVMNGSITAATPRAETRVVVTEPPPEGEV